MQPNLEAIWTLRDALHVTGIYPFTRVTDKANADVEARQFPLRAGFPEDAATGIAAAALAAYLTKYDSQCRSGEHVFRVAQGYTMGALSLIKTLVECEGNAITRIAIRGRAEIVGREHITVR